MLEAAQTSWYKMLSFLSWCTCKITVLFLRMKRFINRSLGGLPFVAHPVSLFVTKSAAHKLNRDDDDDGNNIIMMIKIMMMNMMYYINKHSNTCTQSLAQNHKLVSTRIGLQVNIRRSGKKETNSILCTTLTNVNALLWFLADSLSKIMNN